MFYWLDDDLLSLMSIHLGLVVAGWVCRTWCFMTCLDQMLHAIVLVFGVVAFGLGLWRSSLTQTALRRLGFFLNPVPKTESGREKGKYLNAKSMHVEISACWTFIHGEIMTRAQGFSLIVFQSKRMICVIPEKSDDQDDLTMIWRSLLLFLLKATNGRWNGWLGCESHNWNSNPTRIRIT